MKRAFGKDVDKTERQLKYWCLHGHEFSSCENHRDMKSPEELPSHLELDQFRLDDLKLADGLKTRVLLDE